MAGTAHRFLTQHMPARLLLAILLLPLSRALAQEPASEAADAPPAQAQILSLDEALRRALENNPSIQAAAERVAQTRELVHQARSLYLPQVDADYTLTYSWLPDTIADPALAALDEAEQIADDLKHDLTINRATRLPTGYQRHQVRVLGRSVQDFIDEARDRLEGPMDSATLRVTFGFIVFDGFSRRFTNAMARFGVREAEAAEREGRRILLDAVAQAYYGVQLAREGLKVTDSDIAFNERLLTEARARREAGRGPTSDVLNFEVAVRAARGTQLKTKRELQTARIALAVLMGVPEGCLPDGVDVEELASEAPTDMEKPEAEALIAYALDHRPDVAQRAHGLDRAEAAVGERRAAYAPRVTAFAAAESQSVLDSQLNEDDIGTSVGLNVSMNLYSGGRRKSKVEEAKHAQREAEHRLTEAEVKVTGDVRRALVDLDAAQQALILQRSAAEFVQKNRDLVEKEYNAGRAMLVRLTLAQRDLVTAQVQLALARVALQRAWFGLRTATASTLEEREAETTTPPAGGMDWEQPESEKPQDQP